MPIMDNMIWKISLEASLNMDDDLVLNLELDGESSVQRGGGTKKGGRWIDRCVLMFLFMKCGQTKVSIGQRRKE